jgi:hypothetical protein
MKGEKGGVKGILGHEDTPGKHHSYCDSRCTRLVPKKGREIVVAVETKRRLSARDAESNVEIKIKRNTLEFPPTSSAFQQA